MIGLPLAALLLASGGAARAEPLVVLVTRSPSRSAAETERQRLATLGLADLVIRAVPASAGGPGGPSPSVPGGHALVTGPLDGPLAAMARALEIGRRRLTGLSGPPEVRRPDLSSPAPLAETPSLTDLVGRLSRDRRGYPAVGRVIADRGYAFAAPALDLPPKSEAVAELARGEPLVVLDDRLICSPAASGDGGPAAATGPVPLVLGFDDPSATLELVQSKGLECLRWLFAVQHPFVPASRIAGPQRMLWVPATFALALTGGVTRGKTGAYLSLKGIAGGQVALDAVYEDQEKQRWRRVSFEHPLKDRPAGVLVQPAGFALAGPAGQALRPLPSTELRPGGRGRGRRR